MSIERREFFKVLSAGVLTAASAGPVLAEVRKTIPQDAVGILFDGTICIGCRACEAACKKANGKPAEHKLEQQFGVQGIWDSAPDLDENTLNKIKLYKNGDASVQNREENGFSFIKRACMHCADPDCVSACPVTALTKNPVTGIVHYDKDACIGCRYCQIACAYNIPKFEFNKAIPEIVKCEMCAHLLAKGDIPGCCEFCPTGASLYGKVSDLMAEAKKRVELKEGQSYDYPIGRLKSGLTSAKKASKYINYVYGEKEGGGTQYLILSAVPFTKLGLPRMPEYSNASKSEGLQHTLYKSLIAPIVLFGGLAFAAYRTTKNEPKPE